MLWGEPIWHTSRPARRRCRVQRGGGDQGAQVARPQAMLDPLAALRDSDP